MFTDSEGNVVGTETVTTNDDGDFTTDFVVPAGTPTGTLTVEGTDAEGNTGTDSVEVTPLPYEPVLSGSPDVVEPGQTVTVDSSGWPPNTPIELVFTDSEGNEIGRETVTTDGDGNLTYEFVVPEGTPAGPLDIDATGPEGLEANDTVIVELPRTPVLTAGPPTVTEGETVAVQGAGYAPNSEVELVFTDSEGNIIGTATVDTDATGAFSTEFEVPLGTPVGTLTVDGTDEEGNTGTDSVEVAAILYEPTLSADPTEVEVGEPITVTSSGWPPNTEVEVVFTDANGVVVGTQTVETDADGNFTTEFTVPDGTPAGDLTVTASTPTLTAEDVVTVAEPAPLTPVVTASPSTVTAGETVTTSGNGFAPNSPVEVVYTDSEGNEIGRETVTTDGDGAFTSELVVPDGTPVGDLTVTATDGEGNTGTDTVQVVGIPFTPTLSADPGVVAPGETVTVESSGWPANTPVEVVFTDSEGNVIGSETVTTDASGSFTTEFVVPEGTPAGPLTVTASTPELTASDTVTVRVPAPEPIEPVLTVGPPTVVAGEDVTATGDGFAPNSEVEVVFTDADGTVLGTVTVTTDANGSFSTTFTVPEGAALGTLTAVATDAEGNTATDANEVVAAPVTPTLSADPGSVEPGETVTVESSGWPPNAPVEVVFTDANGNFIGTKTVTTDASGSFTTEFVVPIGTPAGPLTVTATDREGNTATDTVTVTPNAELTLVVDPGTAKPGQTVDVRGGGFTPNSTVTVVRTDSDGKTTEYTVATDASGNFVLPVTFDKGIALGTVTFTATDAAGLTATATAEIVAAGSTPTPGGLSNTGSTFGIGGVVLAALLLALGGGLYVRSRRQTADALDEV